MNSLSIAPSPPVSVRRQPWRLPPRGLAVFHAQGDAARFSHYFLPQVIVAGKHVLYVDGANRIDPLLIARFARQRGCELAEFNQRVLVARAFTCFQLTELLVRVPRALERFPAQVLMVTALPDLYFDQDVRESDARISFERGLTMLRRLGQRLSVGVFSDADSSVTPRIRFFKQLTAYADQVWKFEVQADDKLTLTCERDQRLLPGHS